jgi:predicted metal-binding membrane protein
LWQALRKFSRFRVVTNVASPGVEAKAGRFARLDPMLVTAGLLGAALVAWIVTVDRMRGMDGGPGTDLGGLGWFVGIWVTMMAAMMLPSVSPMVLAFARISDHRATTGRPAGGTWLFVAGYLVVWTAYGLAAYGLYRLVDAVDGGALAWDDAGPWVAGGALVAAGAYQLTPLKDVCLRHCRTPLHFVLHGFREGRTGALVMGAEHGGYCVGCCWGLMVALFALGVMSLTWMAVVAAVIFGEKVTRFGARFSRVVAVALVVLGVWVAVAPGSVPGLTDPANAPAMHMDRMGETPPSMKDDGAKMSP